MGLFVQELKVLDLSAYCVEHADRYKDCTHRDNCTGVWTHHEWESSPSESCANKRRKPRFPESGRKLCGVDTMLTRRSAEARRWLMTGDSCVLGLIWQVTALLTSLMSVASGVWKERKQGHPTTAALLVPHDTLQRRGSLMTHSVHRGISGIWGSNTTWRHTDMLKAPQQILFRFTFLYSSVWVSQTWQQTMDFITAHNSWPGAEFTAHFPLFLSQEDITQTEG